MTEDSSSTAGKLDAILLKLDSNRQEIESAFDQKLSNLREEFVNNAKDIKKLKAETEYSWSREGNRIQFSFNSEVLDGLTSAKQALASGDSDRVSSTINKEVDRLRQRNKLIKIADSSEGGWETVRNYVSNELADDSDDDKKIAKADLKALKKLKQKKSKNGPYPKNVRRSQVSPSPVQYALPASSSVHTQPIQSIQPFRGVRGQRQGSCFACGDFSHYIRECPYRAGSTQSSRAGAGATSTVTS